MKLTISDHITIPAPDPEADDLEIPVTVTGYVYPADESVGECSPTVDDLTVFNASGLEQTICPKDENRLIAVMIEKFYEVKRERRSALYGRLEY